MLIRILSSRAGETTQQAAVSKVRARLAPRSTTGAWKWSDHASGELFSYGVVGLMPRSSQS